MRLFSKWFLFLFLLGLLPSFPLNFVHASDAYANSLYSHSIANALDPLLSVGAPDDAMTSFLGKDAFVFLDMGQGEEGTGDLKLHMLLLDVGATAQIQFLDENEQNLQVENIRFEIGESTPIIPFLQTSSYRYVKITSTEDEPWKLDAIEAQTYATTLSQTTTENSSIDNTSLPNDSNSLINEKEVIPTHGLLFKLPDDGDPQTSVDAAIYFIGADEKRHAFPSETIFFTWFANFDDVSYVTEEQLASYPLGKNVTIRPGTYLIKLETDPKVYAVETGGILRWVETEEIAKKLYGEKWHEQVIDIPDVFFSNYTKGEPLTNDSHSNGTLGITPSREMVYLLNQGYYHLSGEIVEQMHLDSNFAVLIDIDIYTTYTDLGSLTDDLTIKWPY